MKCKFFLSLFLLVASTSALAVGHKVQICHRTGSTTNPTVSIEVSLSALQSHLDHGDSMGSCDCNAIPDDAIFCGGFGAIRCPAGATCIDDPRDGCDPMAGGRDCGGICVFPLTDSAPDDSGACPPGFLLVDDESDDCNPECGDGDCPLLCVATNDAICGDTFAGPIDCTDPAFPDCGETLEPCHEDCGGVHCAGTCVNLAVQPQLTCAEGDCCPEGAICLDGRCWIVVTADGVDGDS